MHRTILHIDFDSFFASVAQQDHPEFRGKPLGVTAHNGRTAIIAASREAKRMGLKNVMRTYEAFKICPMLQLTSADFTRYWEISKRFIHICSDFSPDVEVFSIDELFMDVTLTAHLFGGVDALIKKIKARIKQEIGDYITVSVGVAPNKMLAKMVSGLKKPDGVFAVRAEQLEAIYKIAKLSDICGIGMRIEKRLGQMGIYTLTKLSQTPQAALVAEFGNVSGQFLYSVGQGRDVSPIHSYAQAPTTKSVGRNYCLPRNEYDMRIVLQNMYELCEEICIKLRRLHKKSRCFSIFLRGDQAIYGHTLQGFYSDKARDMFHAVMLVLQRESKESAGFENTYTRQISVTASYLEDSKNLPASLLAIDTKWEHVTTAIDKLNDRYGDHTIRNGFLLYADKLTTVPNGWLADKYERTKLAKIAI